MPDQATRKSSPLIWLRETLHMPNDSMRKTVFVAVALCLVCSVIVASAAVILKPIQQTNQELDRKRNILEVARLIDPGTGAAEIERLFSERVEVRAVDLETGDYTDAVDPMTYNDRDAARDLTLSRPISRGDDIAGIGRQARYKPVYLISADDQLQTIILPVHGQGLWSTMYAFLALAPDGNTVKGLKFYEHGETPGLGGEVDNPRWLAQWPGREIYGEQGEVRIEVVKGGVDPQAPDAEHKVDGLAGATLTARGVSQLLRFWLGENGYGPYLESFHQAQEG